MCIVILVLIVVYKHTTTIITTVTTTTTLPHLALFPDPAQLFVTCSTVLCADENSAGLEMRLEDLHKVVLIVRVIILYLEML